MKINNLRIKNKDKNSIKKLYSIDGINLIETIQDKKEKKDFLSAILYGIRQYATITYQMTVSFDVFFRRVLNQFKIVKRRKNVKVLNFDDYQKRILNKIYTKLCDVKDQNNYIGQIIEYAYLKVVRRNDTVNKIGHEPYISYKRLNLHGNAKYSGRFLDFVSIEDWKYITLCECKANLQQEFFSLKMGKNKGLKQKLQLMNHLETKLIQCHSRSSNDDNFVVINKVLVTAFAPTNQNQLSLAYQRNIPILTISDLTRLL
ncbi:pathogenicity island protein [Mammaliicoccus sciuri]|uniref:pathogenicity island protein n=1 Tax=Mammaliicoccus sciuri TaxID=1296 RepID=UPI0012997512|nr:pathogenicity island protein [Mammaliicoccus sciuri]MRE73201.1 pathogenicity island protein [Mammaliicoccus sciuri]